MSKKIVFDATPFLYPGGVGRATLALYEALCDLDPDLDFTLYLRSFKQYDIPWQRIRHPVRGFRLPRIAEKFMRGAKVIERITEGDLYHATDHYLPVKDRHRCVATLHDLLFLLEPDNDWESHRYFAKEVPEFAVNCGAVICPSQHTKMDLINHLQMDPEKIHVIPWGIDRDLFHPTKDQSKVRNCIKEKFGDLDPFYFAVGCSTGRKNTPRLLKAYMQLLKQGCSTHLVLAWNPPESIRKEYQHEKIHFLGRVSDSSLVELYSAAKAAVYPSIYEGFGFPILEAMSCGCPVVTSSTSSMREVGGQAAIYVDPESDDSILNALEKAENEPDTLKLLSEAGLKQSQKFSWKRCAEETLSLYRYLLQRVEVCQ